MKNKETLRGLKSVYSFTLCQTLKNKTNIMTMVMLFIIVLFSLPLQAISNSSTTVSPIQTAYITNDSGIGLDFNQLKTQSFSDVVFETADFDTSSYADRLGEGDVYIKINEPDASGSCSLEAHTIEESTLNTEDLQPLLTAISTQLTASSMSIDDSLASQYQVESMSASEYREPKTESLGFDGGFAIQYGYAIVVMILCMLAASFIIRCVITEKESKLIELLMVSVSPLALLLGKILAIMTYVILLIVLMAVGLVLSYQISVQLFNMASIGSVLSQVGIDLSLLRLNAGTIVIALISLLLAFATYAVLSGLIGTCCNTTEQSEPAIMIVTALVMVGYIASCVSPAISDNPVLAAIFSLCPVISVYCAPVLYVCGDISFVVLVLSWLIQAVILIGLSAFCAKVYRDLLLYRGNKIGFSQMFQIFKNGKKEGARL